MAALDSALRDSGTGYSGEMEVSAEQAKAAMTMKTQTWLTKPS